MATNTGTLLAVTGLLIADWIATAGRDPVLIASTSIGFGLLFGAADRWGKRRRGMGTLTLWDAVPSPPFRPTSSPGRHGGTASV